MVLLFWNTDRWPLDITLMRSIGGKVVRGLNVKMYGQFIVFLVASKTSLVQFWIFINHCIIRLDLTPFATQLSFRSKFDIGIVQTVNSLTKTDDDDSKISNDCLWKLSLLILIQATTHTFVFTTHYIYSYDNNQRWVRWFKLVTSFM